MEYKGGEAHFGAVLDGVETPRGCATRFNISFHENAKVYSGELARDATIDGITYKQGTAIRLRGVRNPWTPSWSRRTDQKARYLSRTSLHVVVTTDHC